MSNFTSLIAGVRGQVLGFDRLVVYPEEMLDVSETSQVSQYASQHK